MGHRWGNNAVNVNRAIMAVDLLLEICGFPGIGDLLHKPLADTVEYCHVLVFNRHTRSDICLHLAVFNNGDAKFDCCVCEET